MSLWKDFDIVKYEKIYLSPPEDGLDLYERLVEHFTCYNSKRRHTGINNQLPE